MSQKGGILSIHWDVLIELAKERRRLIQSNPDRYTADFQV